LQKVKQVLQCTTWEALMCGGLEASHKTLPEIWQCPALQPNLKVTIIQQAVCDSGFVQ